MGSAAGLSGMATVAAVLSVAAVVSLALLAAVVVPMGGRLGRWWRGRDRPRCGGGRGRRQKSGLRLHLQGVANAMFFLQKV